MTMNYGIGDYVVLVFLSTVVISVHGALKHEHPERFFQVLENDLGILETTYNEHPDNFKETADIPGAIKKVLNGLNPSPPPQESGKKVIKTTWESIKFEKEWWRFKRPCFVLELRRALGILTSEFVPINFQRDNPYSEFLHDVIVGIVSKAGPKRYPKTFNKIMLNLFLLRDKGQLSMWRGTLGKKWRIPKEWENALYHAKFSKGSLEVIAYFLSIAMITYFGEDQHLEKIMAELYVYNGKENQNQKQEAKEQKQEAKEQKQEVEQKREEEEGLEQSWEEEEKERREEEEAEQKRKQGNEQPPGLAI